MNAADIERIRRIQERKMRGAALATFTGIRDNAILNEIVKALDAGDIERAVEAINIGRAQFATLEVAITEAYTAGATATAAQLPLFPVAKTGAVIKFAFDVRSPRAEKWLASKSSGRIVEIMEDQRAMARRVLTAGLEAGRNPRNVALDVIGRIDRATGRRAGGFIGLTDHQAGYVLNMRKELSSGNPAQMANYFTRERRDKRLDGIVERAIANGKPISESNLDAITARYNDRLLQLRGETIARTESLDALRAGQQESVQQAIELGDIDKRDAVKEWDASGDMRTRPSHYAAEGQRVPIDQPFNVGGFLLMYPGDSSLGAPASETINCRCREKIVIDFIGKALRIEGF